jgi:D-alanyl-lipoteichoic acid acyltransferase DltB (MBOAT superfamily)
LLFAAAKLFLGAALFWGLSRIVPPGRELLRGWVGMVGLILMLHFGTFHLLSCWWRTLGIEARPLMNDPLASTSLSEFWGKRWNTAFRDLTHRFLFRPLTTRLGPRAAVAAGFVFSGLVHELVISVPAGGGYGWPMLFFVVQGAALLAERTSSGRVLGLGQGWRGFVFTTLVLAAPAYGLFHPPFIRNVVVPFMIASGAGGPS